LRNGGFHIEKSGKRALLTSIETDGVGVSLVLATERKMGTYIKGEKTAKEKRDYCIMKRRSEVERLSRMLPVAVCKGIDPGRANLYTSAHKTSEATYERQFYSRERHLDQSGQKRLKKWREERAKMEHISEALDDLSRSEGATCCDAHRWTNYVVARHRHMETLRGEFMENDDRCKLRMVGFRLRQRALARAADRLVLQEKKEGKPVIIGYGNGRNNGGGHRGEASVPVKQMYKAIMAAFRRHRVKGGVLDIGEDLTTQKCHKCQNYTSSRNVGWSEQDVNKAKDRIQRKLRRGQISENDIPSDDELRANQKIDRDFRVCEHCSTTEQTTKVRNRDFNASINILHVLIAELNGEDRPAYLCVTRRNRGRKRRIMDEVHGDHETTITEE
jgi:hypothetical protein